jgi:hypothetical protein
VGLVGGEKGGQRGGPRRQAVAAARATAPARGAAPAAHWDAEWLACEGREGAVSSEDRRAGLGGGFGGSGQRTAAARPW